MPLTLEGSCRCGKVSFTVASHTPQPYQLCYCSICRKTAGGGGYAINLSAVSDSLRVEGGEELPVAPFVDPAAADAHPGAWPDLVHPFASAIDSKLPTPPERVHLMLRYKPSWVVPDIGPHDRTFDEYPEESIADWHKRRGLWVD